MVGELLEGAAFLAARTGAPIVPDRDRQLRRGDAEGEADPQAAAASRWWSASHSPPPAGPEAGGCPRSEIHATRPRRLRERIQAVYDGAARGVRLAQRSRRQVLNTRWRSGTRRASWRPSWTCPSGGRARPSGARSPASPAAWRWSSSSAVWYWSCSSRPTTSASMVTRRARKPLEVSVRCVPVQPVHDPGEEHHAGLTVPVGRLVHPEPPGGHHEVGGVVDQRLEHRRHLRRVVLAVGVEGDHVTAPRRAGRGRSRPAAPRPCPRFTGSTKVTAPASMADPAVASSPPSTITSGVTSQAARRRSGRAASTAPMLCLLLEGADRARPPASA